MKIAKYCSIALLLFSLPVRAALPAPGTGASTTWTGAASDGLWANPGNWSGGKVPSMALGAVISTGTTITIADGDNADWLQVNGSDPVTLVGGALNTPAILSQGSSPLQIGCQVRPSGALTVNGAIQVNSGGGISVTNGGWSQSGNLTLLPNASIVFARSASATMSLTGHLTNQGGSVTLNGGALNISGNLVNNGGTLNIRSGGLVTPKGLFTSGTLNFTNGQLNCSAPWNVTGDITLALAPGTTNRMYVGATTNVTWSGQVNITGYVVGDTANRITIGNNKACASQAQIAAINFVNDSGNSPAYLNSYGWVLPDSAITITSQPTSVTTNAASQVVFGVGYFSKYPVTFQWQKNGQNISGATGPSYTIPSATTTDAGTYNVLLKSTTTTDSSRAAALNVLSTTITQQPVEQKLAYGNALRLAVAVTNANTPITYQWLHNGQPITGATSPTYTAAATGPADDGDYSVTVTSPSGNVTSSVAQVTVGPVITQQPASVQVKCGQTLTLSVAADGSQPLVYQWLQDGRQIEGATSAALNIASATYTNAGSYTVVVSNPAGSVSSSPTTVTVVPADPPVLSLVGLANGATFISGTTLNFGYSITDPNGSPIVGAGLLRDGAAWVSDMQSMSSLAWTPPVGTHTLIATATNAYGTPAKLTTTITIAEPLSVSITNPKNNQGFTSPGYVTLQATVAGGIQPTNLTFIVDGTVLAQVPNAPYQFPWFAQSGSHTIVAVARDVTGASATNTVTVSCNFSTGYDLAPMSEGGTCDGPLAVDNNNSTSADVTGSGGIITRSLFSKRTVFGVQMYWKSTTDAGATGYLEYTIDGSTWTTLTSFYVQPWSPGWATWAPASPIQATGVRLRMRSLYSNPVQVYTWNIWGDPNENPGDPSGSITAPANGSVVPSPLAVPFTVASTDDGYVGVAKLYVDNNLVASQSGSNNYTFYWSGTSQGNHIAYAAIQDNLGRWRNTSTINFSISYASNYYDLGPLSEGGTCDQPSAVDSNNSTAAAINGSGGSITRMFFNRRTIYGVQLNWYYTTSGNATGTLEYTTNGTTWASLTTFAIPTGSAAWSFWSPVNPIQATGIRIRSTAINANNVNIYSWNIWGDHNENPSDPTGSIVSPAAEAVITNPLALPFTAAASDNDGFVGTAQLYIDGSQVATASGSNTFTAYWSSPRQGNHSAYIALQDNMGRWRNTATINFSVSYASNYYDIGPLDEGGTCDQPNTVDSNNSTSADISGSGGSLTRMFSNLHTIYGVQFYWYYTTSGNATGTLEYTTNGTAWTQLTTFAIPTGSAAWAYWSPVSPIRATGIRIRSTAINANAVRIYSWNIWGDHNENPYDPVGQIVSPANGSTWSSPLSLPFQVSASDADGYVTAAQIYVDGTLLQSATGSNIFAFNWNTGAPGSHATYAVLQDEMGRIRYTPTNSFTIAYANNIYDVGLSTEGGTCANSTDGTGASAFDGNDNTSSTAAGTSSGGAILTRTLATTRTVYGVEVCELNSTLYTPSTSVIEYSPDGTTWTALATNTWNISTKAWARYGFASPMQLKALRIRGLSNITTVYTFRIWGDHNENPNDPVGQITSPAPGSTVTSPLALPFAVTGSDADDFVASASLYIDGNYIASASGVNNFTLLWPNAAPGSHSAYASVQDQMGRIRNTPTNNFTIAYSTNIYDIGPLSEGGTCTGPNAVDNDDNTGALANEPASGGSTITRTYPVVRSVYGVQVNATWQTLYSAGTAVVEYSPDGSSWIALGTNTWSGKATVNMAPSSPISVKAMRIRGTKNGVNVYTWRIWANKLDDVQAQRSLTIALSEPTAEESATTNAPAAGGSASKTYNGLFYEQTGVVWEHSGAVTLTVDATNSYEGVVLTRGQSYTIKGMLSTDGQADVTIVRTNDTVLGISFGVNQGSLTGTVGDETWTATLQGEAVSGSDVMGNYDIWLNGGQTGSGSLTISNSVASLRLILSDASSVGQSCGLSATGQWPFYQELYHGQGGVLGWMQWSPTNVWGTGVWMRPGQTNEALSVGITAPNATAQ